MVVSAVAAGKDMGVDASIDAAVDGEMMYRSLCDEGRRKAPGGR
jgi:hypothetical protein